MKREGYFRPLLLVALALLLGSMLAGCEGAPAASTSTPSTLNLPAGLHVVGNRIGVSDGHTLTYHSYHGVNRSGSEYICTEKGSTFDGPSDQASINAILAWKVTIVRVPLNEDCWLGINGFPTAGRTAAEYRQDIVNYVELLRQNNLAVILDLHWNAPGSQQALKQKPMPDADHAPAFWSSVASTFKNDLFVMFDLYNEPYTIYWNCWLAGSAGANAKPCQDVDFAVAGMQTLINTVRSAGASNVILVGGLDYANNMYGWLQYKPHDPQNNLAADFHIYPPNSCSDTACLDDAVAPVAAHYPVLTDEMGEFDCGDNFINGLMPWFDSHKISYLAWAWDTHDCSQFPALISDYSGMPTGYGAGFKAHLSSF